MVSHVILCRILNVSLHVIKYNTMIQRQCFAKSSTHPNTVILRFDKLTSFINYPFSSAETVQLTQLLSALSQKLLYVSSTFKCSLRKIASCILNFNSNSILLCRNGKANYIFVVLKHYPSSI